MDKPESSLKKRVLSGTLWMTGLSFSGQLFTWAVTLYVIRLLKPQDYGLMAMAGIFIGFLTILNEIGLGPAVVQKADISEEELRKASGCVIMINASLFVLIYFSAPLVAFFFSEPRIVKIIRVLGINFLLLSLYFLPQSILRRILAFKTKSFIDLGANIASSITVFTLAYHGLGVWALVLGQTAMHLFKVVGFNCLKDLWYLPIFSMKGLKKILKFGGFVSINRVLWYFYSQADILIGGRLFGKEALGVYAVAMQIVSIPMSKINPIISQIGFSAFSRMQQDIHNLQSSFLRLCWLINLVSIPGFIGLALVAPQAVPLIFTAKWSGIVLPIQLLSIVMPFRFVGFIYGPITTARGRPDIITGNMLLAIIVMPAAFIIASKWGILGLCYAWAVAYPCLFMVISMRTLKVLQLNWAALRNTASLPLLGSFPMAISVLIFRNQLAHMMPPWMALVSMIALGASIYVIAVLSIDRSVLKKLRAIFSST